MKITMPKKKRKAVEEAVNMTPVQAQPKPRVEEEFHFNKYTTKRVKIKFVAEAEVDIADLK